MCINIFVRSFCLVICFVVFVFPLFGYIFIIPHVLFLGYYKVGEWSEFDGGCCSFPFQCSRENDEQEENKVVKAKRRRRRRGKKYRFI